MKRHNFKGIIFWLLGLLILLGGANKVVKADDAWPPAYDPNVFVQFYLDTEANDLAVFGKREYNPGVDEENIKNILKNISYVYVLDFNNTSNGFVRVDIVSENASKEEKENHGWFQFEPSPEDADFDLTAIQMDTKSIVFNLPTSWNYPWGAYKEIDFVKPDLTNAVISIPGLTGKNGEISGKIYEMYDYRYGDISYIDSYLVNVYLDNKKLDPDDYTVTVEKRQGTTYLKGLIASNLFSDKYESAENYFRDNSYQVQVVEQKKILLDSPSVKVLVDDRGCNFSSDEKMKPTVSVSIPGVFLEEGTDFRVVYDYPSLVGESGRVKIYALDGSEYIQAPEKGTYISSTFQCDFVEISDFYTLEGIPDTIAYDGFLPGLYGGGKDSVPLEELSGRLYLKPKGSFIGGYLPKITNGLVDRSLYSDRRLKVSYSLDGINFAPDISWEDGNIEDSIYIKVDVVHNGSVYDESSRWDYCYLDGSIIKAVPILFRSLDEVNPGKNPATAPDRDGRYVMAYLNTTSSPWPTAPYMEEYKDSPLETFTYTGKELKPNLNIGIFDYYNNPQSLFAPIPYPFSYPVDQQKYVKSITYENNINAGTGKVTVAFKGYFSGSVTREFTILPKEMKADELKISADDLIYSGKQALPKITIKDGDNLLVEGKDYTATFEQGSDGISLGKQKIQLTGKGNYKGSLSLEFTIVPKELKKENLKINLENPDYTGKQVMPKLSIYDGTYLLVEGKDYTVALKSGSDGISAGKQEIQITGKGNYKGSISLEFTIEKPVVPDDTKKTAFTKVETGERGVKLGWNRQKGATGYQVLMSSNRNGKYKKVVSTKKNKCYVYNLKKGYVYYFKLRAYTKKNGKTVYGPASDPTLVIMQLQRPNVSLTAKKKAVTVSFNPVPKAKGYKIWIKTSSKGKWKCVKDITKFNSRKKISYTVKNLKSGSTVYVRIKAYRTVEGQNWGSPYSKLKRVRIK